MTFAGLILAAPLGFLNGCNELSSLDDEKFAAVLSVALAASRSGHAPAASTVCEGTKSLMYIIYALNSSTPRPEVTELAAVLDSHTALSRACITSLVGGLDAAAAELGAGESSICGGKLTGLQWRLGVSLASSSCSQLLSPYVALNFTVTDSNGEKKVHSAELTYKEFHAFHQSIQRVANTMDSL
jgi:hypothetical protein